jgi:hypothetical protein
MADYQNKLQARLRENALSCAFLNIQPVFGRADNPGEYGLAGAPFPMFANADHPNYAGGAAIGQEEFTMWTQG